jgi:hypothetical protein
VHDEEGDWMVADGVNDPNKPGAALVTHMRHVVELDPSISELSSLPRGYQAHRAQLGSPWVIEEHSYEN